MSILNPFCSLSYLPHLCSIGFQFRVEQSTEIAIGACPWSWSSYEAKQLGVYESSKEGGWSE